MATWLQNWISGRHKAPLAEPDSEMNSSTSATTTPAPELGNSGQVYQPHPGIFDEMLAADGSVRNGWGPLASWFTNTDPASQLSCAQKIERLVFENFSDPQRGRQLWHLDLIPLVLDRPEWSRIAAAASQRARLYNALLADLYGEQSVFSKGILPPTLVMSDMSYLRPLHGVLPDGGHLTFLALDFARDPQGNWRIIDTHTETPAGHGFALANRMVVAEVFGSLFRQTRATRIGQFYQDLTDDILRRAKGDNPTIAVLAPGPTDAAFVGHSYMARYMGQMRVEGSDLRVVGNRVYLKTVDGLKKIDLLVRAIEGHRADPLELSPDGFDGPVGLVEACRQNSSLMINALGTAVVENRGLSGYLPALSRHFLGEDIALNDSPRIWLGERFAREQVLASLGEYIIHDAQEGTGSPGQAAQGRSVLNLSPEARTRLEDDIRFNGQKLVAECPVGFSTAPAWTPDGLRPEPYALRVFVASIDGEFQVMPGGLALTVDSGATVALSSTQARSRDVWITTDDSLQPTVSLIKIAAQHSTTVQRHAIQLQSRVADNLFWLGRYCERADGILRIVRQTLQRSTADLLAMPSSYRPFAALRRLVEQDEVEGFDFATAAAQSDSSAIWLNEICSNKARSLGLPVTFKNIQNIAVQCRDRLSEDSWRILTSLDSEPLSCLMPAKDAPTQLHPIDTLLPSNALDIIESADALIERLAAFAGMSHENMTRNTGWLFMDLGRRIERAKQLSELLLALLDKVEDEDTENDDLLFVLQTADSYITFRSRYRFAPEASLVLDLLVIDETNPRSLAYQLSMISEHIAQLPKSADDAVRAPDQRLALEILTKVRLADAGELAEVDAKDNRTNLRALLETIIAELPHLTELVSRQYFSLADEQPQRLHPQSEN